jgi:hypothetical protein
MSREVTVLDSIIEEVATELYNKWAAAIPEENKNEEAFRALGKNAHDTTILVIQSFMNKFNEAAEELKNS